MSDFSKAAIARVEALVATTWSEIGAQFRISQGAWYNWRDRVKAGDLTPPFAALSVLGETPTNDWGPTNKTYNLGLAVYYVRSTDLSAGEISGGATKIEDLIYPKVASLRDALITNSTSFQLVEDPRVSLGIDNPANAYLSENADAFWAGEVMFEMLVGETYR
jgi:hypothetical protein